MNRRASGWLFLVLVLGMGLIHGLLYVYLVPPWQHNDEPNHFEHAWLVAHRSSLPKSNDSDPEMSRAVMQSMAQHHFFDDLGYLPDLTSGQPVSIVGWSQLGDPPLYYWLASLPIRLVGAVAPNASIEAQLYAARWASLFLLLVSLFAAWGLVRELTDPANPLRWLVPLTLALWPGYIDLMTAVTNYAGAVAFFSVFLWFGVRLIRRGFGWGDMLGAVLSTAACCWTLSGVYIAVPLLCVALLFVVFRKRWRWCAWGLLFSGVVIVCLAVFTWGDADLWYRETFQAETTSNVNPDAPLGNRAFYLPVSSQAPQNKVYQFIPPHLAREMEGKMVTLGAWVWATRSVKVNSPILQTNDGRTQYAEMISVIETPTFHAITATYSGETRAWIILSSPTSATDAGVDVFFDGVVLAIGSYPLDQAPNIEDQDYTAGTWGDMPYTNLVRNSSAEIVGPRIRLWVDRRQVLGTYGRVSMFLYTIRDWSGAGWYFRSTAANLFRTLWGRFGWNHVPFLGHKPYRLFLVATLLGVVGVLVVTYRMRKQIPWEPFIWLGLAVFMISVLTVAKGMFYLWYKPFIPSARYMYPVVPVIVLTLCAGWWELLSVLARWIRPWILSLAYVILFLGVDIYALVSLMHYY